MKLGELQDDVGGGGGGGGCQVVVSGQGSILIAAVHCRLKQYEFTMNLIVTKGERREEEMVIENSELSPSLFDFVDVRV